MNTISVSVTVHAPIEKVWESWTKPEHITKWNQASADWHSPFSENDLRRGGKFRTTMAAKDGSASFDFEGTYAEVIENKLIKYMIADGRKVEVTFEEVDGGVLVTEKFETENVYSPEEQRQGWQSILESFKRYTEGADS